MTGFTANGTCLINSKAATTTNGTTAGNNNTTTTTTGTAAGNHYTAMEHNSDDMPSSSSSTTTASATMPNDRSNDDAQMQMVLNEENYSYDAIKLIADFLLERTDVRPKIGIICGSGLNSLADYLEDACAFEYKEIPNFPVSTVEGHVGRMIFGQLGGLPVVAMQGRFHYYEGYPLAKCSMPVRVMKLIGIKYLMATNAAGGLNPKFKVGDIMIVRDHINIMGFAGNSPLQGPNDPRFGPRFPPMTNAYNTQLITKAKEIARDLGIGNDVHEGVYTCLGGPNYETVAELRMLRTMGVDAVGMSTVHEVITARHCDLTVFAFSLITNKCALDYTNSEEEANHEEVVMVGKSRESVCAELMCRVISHIAEQLKNQK